MRLSDLISSKLQIPPLAILDIVEKTAKKVFVPLTVGGGINTIEDVKNNVVSTLGQSGHL